MKLEVVSPLRHAHLLRSKVAPRRQLHTINTAPAGLVVAAIKVANGDDRSGAACVCESGGNAWVLSF